MAQVPRKIQRQDDSAPGGLRVILWRWYGMVPAAVVLGAFSMLWGVLFMASGYWEQMSVAMDEDHPLVVSLSDGVTLSEAEALASRLEEAPEIRSARAISADVALENALPERQSWAQEIGRIDAHLIPPTLVVVVEGGVRDRSRRAEGAAVARALGQGRIDLIWRDGADLLAARTTLENTRRLIDRGLYAALALLVGAWLAFVLIDMRHFVFLVGRDQAFDFIGENIVLRRFSSSLMRGGIIGGVAALLAALGLTATPLIIGMPAPAWALRAALSAGAAFAMIAGMAGHGVMGWVLWRQAHRPPKGALPG